MNETQAILELIQRQISDMWVTQFCISMMILLLLILKTHDLKIPWWVPLIYYPIFLATGLLLHMWKF